MSEKTDGDGPVQHSSTLLRTLNDAEKAKLNKDTQLVSEFKRNKLELEAKKNWDLFYKRNTTKFFKDRQWTTREFEELTKISENGRTVLLEVGCGVGNFLFPLLERNEEMFIYACDFSPRAVQFVKDHELYDSARCSAFQCDLTSDPLTATIAPHSVDIVTLIFVLSAINPDKMANVLRNIKSVLRPGGSVLIRDYGLYDHAMLRFAPGHKLADQFYVRQDGTRAYYFTLEELVEMFTNCGFTSKKHEYVYRSTVNKKEGIDVPRVFVQGSFTNSDSLSKETNSQKEELTVSTSSDSEESNNLNQNDVTSSSITCSSDASSSNSQIQQSSSEQNDKDGVR